MKKIHNPCSCTRLKRIHRCQHMKDFGNTTGEAFVCSRDSQDSADSEMMIKMSNRRISNAPTQFAQGTVGLSPSPPNSLNQVLSDLLKVGNAIGIELGNDPSILKNLIGKGVGDESR